VLAVVDTGPLYAAVDASDDDHEASLAALKTEGVRLVVPAMVVAEATFLVGMRMGPKVESAFLKGLVSYNIEAPTPDDLLRMAELTLKYADFPLGGTDASVIALAERLRTTHIVTLDVRHFGAVRLRNGRRIDILPSL
jgi:uncharacterized protein